MGVDDTLETVRVTRNGTPRQGPTIGQPADSHPESTVGWGGGDGSSAGAAFDGDGAAAALTLRHE